MEVSISIRKKIFHLTRVATAWAAAGFRTKDDVLICASRGHRSRDADPAPRAPCEERAVVQRSRSQTRTLVDANPSTELIGALIVSLSPWSSRKRIWSVPVQDSFQ